MTTQFLTANEVLKPNVHYILGFALPEQEAVGELRNRIASPLGGSLYIFSETVKTDKIIYIGYIEIQDLKDVTPSMIQIALKATQVFVSKDPVDSIQEGMLDLHEGLDFVGPSIEPYRWISANETIAPNVIWIAAATWDHKTPISMTEIDDRLRPLGYFTVLSDTAFKASDGVLVFVISSESSFTTPLELKAALKASGFVVATPSIADGTAASSILTSEKIRRTLGSTADVILDNPLDPNPIGALTYLKWAGIAALALGVGYVGFKAWGAYREAKRK